LNSAVTLKTANVLYTLGKQNIW